MRCLAAFALLAGCSGLDFGQFPAALEDARCAYFVRCGLVASATECRAYFDRVAVDPVSAEAALDAGKLVFHADTAQACLDAHAALSCDITQQTGHELDACNDVLTGTLAIGESCAFDNECESNNCEVPSCTMACCTGTCGAPTALPEVGQPCTALCAGDAYCGVDGICHAPLPSGAACNEEPCEFGLYCAGRTATTSGTCKPLPHIGQPCESVCAEIGAICYGGTCTAVGILGDACTADAQCSMFYNCKDMTCALLPTLGMPCTTTCYEAAYCEAGTCVAQKANGADCIRNDECKSHYCSRTAAAGTCADVPVCF
jgi:hypothetical protein